MELLIEGLKCPLAAHRLTLRIGWVRRQWRKIIQRIPAVRSWLAHVRMLGYERFVDAGLTGAESVATSATCGPLER